MVNNIQEFAKHFDAAVRRRKTAVTSKKKFFLNLKFFLKNKSLEANNTSSRTHFICKFKCESGAEMVIADLAGDEATPSEGNAIVEKQRIFINGTLSDFYSLVANIKNVSFFFFFVFFFKIKNI